MNTSLIGLRVQSLSHSPYISFSKSTEYSYFSLKKSSISKLANHFFYSKYNVGCNKFIDSKFDSILNSAIKVEKENIVNQKFTERVQILNTETMIQNCYFARCTNFMSRGGAIYSAFPLSIISSSFYECQAKNGGVVFFDSSMYVSYCGFDTCSADNGGIAKTEVTSYCTFKECSFLNTKSNSNGIFSITPFDGFQFISNNASKSFATRTDAIGYVNSDSIDMHFSNFIYMDSFANAGFSFISPRCIVSNSNFIHSFAQKMAYPTGLIWGSVPQNGMNVHHSNFHNNSGRFVISGEFDENCKTAFVFSCTFSCSKDEAVFENIKSYNNVFEAKSIDIPKFYDMLSVRIQNRIEQPKPAIIDNRVGLSMYVLLAIFGFVIGCVFMIILGSRKL